MEKIISAADTGHEILDGENVITTVFKSQAQGVADRLCPLPRLTAYFNAEFNHEIRVTFLGIFPACRRSFSFAESA